MQVGEKARLAGAIDKQHQFGTLQGLFLWVLWENKTHVDRRSVAKDYVPDNS